MWRIKEKYFIWICWDLSKISNICNNRLKCVRGSTGLVYVSDDRACVVTTVWSPFGLWPKPQDLVHRPLALGHSLQLHQALSLLPSIGRMSSHPWMCNSLRKYGKVLLFTMKLLVEKQSTNVFTRGGGWPQPCQAEETTDVSRLRPGVQAQHGWIIYDDSLPGDFRDPDHKCNKAKSVYVFSNGDKQTRYSDYNCNRAWKKQSVMYSGLNLRGSRTYVASISICDWLNQPWIR